MVRFTQTAKAKAETMATDLERAI